MTIDFVVRRAEAADAPSMARVHVDTWRETYRGLMSDAVLAQAFYRKHGFVADGVVKTEDDVREIRMVRAINAVVAC
jgi:predicted GNAT family N-acyltransferase